MKASYSGYTDHLYPNWSLNRTRDRTRSGQGMTEYAMVLALIALVVIATVSVVGRRVAQSFCGVSAGLSGGVSSAYAAMVLRDCPAAYWRFGEPAGSAKGQDSSGHGNTLSYYVGAGVVDLAQPGAIVGDPDTAVYATLAVGLAPTVVPAAGDFSIETWFNLNSVPTGATEMLMMWEENYRVTGFRFGLTSTADLAFWTDQSGGSIPAASTTVPSIGTWHHAVAVIAGTQVTVYLDGVALGSGSGSLFRTSSGLELGGRTPNVHFDGRMDDTAVYATALTATQVANHYRAAGYALP